jgi:thiol-disulfide isomerase/thioredoxin
MSAQKISRERFAQGMTIEQFVDGMEKNWDVFEQNYRGFNPGERDIEFLRELDLRLNVLVLAEDWCGDVLLYVPTFARMSEAVSQWQVRVFKRDENPDLADMWLKDGKYRAIPVIVFFDEDMNEIACYIERPKAVVEARRQAREVFAAQHPELPDAGTSPDQMSETTGALYSDFMRQLRATNRLEWQRLFVEEIKSKLGEARPELAMASGGR